MSQFQIRRHDFSVHRTVAIDADRALDDGEVRLQIDCFAYTANNITYAALGDRLGYWTFFPAAGDDAASWGITPVWGFANVVESCCAEVAVGERLYGYFPPASTVILRPIKLTSQRLFDGSAHRAALPPGYNSYSRVNGEPGYDSRMDAARMLLWPLHMTSFVLWQALSDARWHGAKQLLIPSASSKTAIGLAHALANDPDVPPVIGLTSERNREFVDRLGLYSQVIAYDQLDRIDAGIATTIVDLSGSAELLSELAQRLGNQLCRCINVGMTHWDEGAASPAIDASLAELFFAPAEIQKRMKEWGADVFSTRATAFLAAAAKDSGRWLQFTDVDGLGGLANVYPDVLSGRLPAEQGLIVRMPD